MTDLVPGSRIRVKRDIPQRFVLNRRIKIKLKGKLSALKGNPDPIVFPRGTHGRLQGYGTNRVYLTLRRNQEEYTVVVQSRVYDQYIERAI